VPSQPPGTRRSRQASERQAVKGTLHDGAGTSAAMTAQGGIERHVTYQLPGEEGSQVLQYQGDERPPGHGGASAMPQQQRTAGRPKPYYVPPSRTRRTGGEQPPYAEASWSRPAIEQPPVHGPYPPLGGVQEERLPAALPQGGAPPDGGSRFLVRGEDERPRRKGFGIGTRKKKEPRTASFLYPADPRAAHGAHPRAPGESGPGGESLAAPVGAAALDAGSLAAPPGRGSLAKPGGAAPPFGGRGGVPNANTIERVSFPPVPGGSPQPPRQEHDAYPHPHPQQELELYPRMTPTAGRSPGKMGRPSPLLLQQRKKKRGPLALCFTLCCILFWLLVVGVGVAVLVVYLLYHPQPPRLRVTTATLNAGYIDQLPPPYGGLALNSDLYVLATIYNPNTKIDVVLRYMQLDLYFHGVMIGTQSVWPPIHAVPGDTELRNVHLVVSEVRMSREDAEAWHNATAKNGLVEVKLAAKFHVQLNFGRWLPFRYWVYPSCSLWLDPPPGGALRRARCRKSAY
jgi:LEA14-like dessication related protein